jgi:hypothetical protein
MDTGNLQMQGLCLALASLNELLVEKGLVSQSEVDTALARAEAGATGDDRFAELLAPQQRDAVCFPIRFLRLANEGGADLELSFSGLAKRVGMTKAQYNDQR